MALKSNLMGNSNLFVFPYLIYIAILASCGESKTKNIENVAHHEAFINKHQETTIFNPDSTINNILILDNRVSSIKFYPSIDKMNFISYLRESPVLGFYNKDSSEYLLAYQYEGGVQYAFDCFEIGYTDKEIKREYPLISRANSFKTESGLGLGMTVDDLIKTKGDSYQRKNDSIVIYQIENYSSSEFLQKYNMPAYFLTCTVKNSKIVKIKFGFVYP